MIVTSVTVLCLLPPCPPLAILQLSLKPTPEVENTGETLIRVAVQSEESLSKVLTTAVATTYRTFLSNEFYGYEKYARWQARTGNPFIDYFTVLDIGIRWEKGSLGKLTEDECVYARYFCP